MRKETITTIKKEVKGCLDLGLNDLKGFGVDKLTTLKTNTGALLETKLNKNDKEDFEMFLETITSLIEELGQVELKKVASAKAPRKSAPKKEDKPVKEDLKKEDPKKEEPKEEPKKEDKPKKEEPKKEDQKKDKLTTEKKATTGNKAPRQIKTGDSITLANKDYESNYRVVDANKYNVILRCMDQGNEMNVILLDASHVKQGYIEFDKKEGQLSIIYNNVK